MEKIIAVVPAYNEEKNIGAVVSALKKHTDEIIVIDDGSEDKTCQIAQKSGAKVYCHLINRGLGGALGTGVKAALSEGADIIATLDADGQHNPAEIPRLLEPIIKKEADIVIGSRFLKNQEMPFFRRIGNYFLFFCRRAIYRNKVVRGLLVFYCCNNGCSKYFFKE